MRRRYHGGQHEIDECLLAMAVWGAVFMAWIQSTGLIGIEWLEAIVAGSLAAGFGILNYALD